jgi:hypothetical protein
MLRLNMAKIWMWNWGYWSNDKMLGPWWDGKFQIVKKGVFKIGLECYF